MFSQSWLAIKTCEQWQRHTRAYQGKCPGRNTSALAVKSGNNKMIYQDILTALADATNDLSMPYHEQRTGAATACEHFEVVIICNRHACLLIFRLFICVTVVFMHLRADAMLKQKE